MTNIINQSGAGYYYSGAGTNTLANVSSYEAQLYNIEVTALGSPGYLQVYNNSSTEAGAGTPDMVFYVGELATRSIPFGPVGTRLKGGLSYLWGTAASGTAVNAGNIAVNIIYQGTS